MHTAELEKVDVPELDISVKRTSRQGTNKRQRTERLLLSLLPTEREALEQAAARSGYSGKLQQFILHKLADDLATV